MSCVPTILYVDDDDNDVLLLKHALRCAKLTFDVRVVNDPENASAYLAGHGAYADRALHPFPAFVLLDLKMPRLHGLEVLTWIRRQPQLERVIVIVLTASNHAPEIRRAYELGANLYLLKPVDLGHLVEIVRGMSSFWRLLGGQPGVYPRQLNPVASSQPPSPGPKL